MEGNIGGPKSGNPFIQELRKLEAKGKTSFLARRRSFRSRGTPFHSMDSGSDSDGSHVSATPPRNSSPPPRSRRIPSSYRAPATAPARKPHPKPTSTTATAATTTTPFPSADFSFLPSLSSKSSSVSSARSSFSTFVRSRKPFLDPSLFAADDVPVVPSPQIATRRRGRDRDAILKTLPNWIGSKPGGVGDRPPVEAPKRFRFSNEGNFVKLNINGYGRRRIYGGKKRWNSSRSRRKARSWRGGKGKGGGADASGVGEESGLDLDLGAERKGGSYDRVLVDEAVRAVREEPSDGNFRKLLKLTHGYDSFREGQLEAIRRVVAGKSTMLVLPTGSGKTLCYQLPALVLPGLTLVVSPLVALMLDQLQNLPPMIPGALLCSSQTIEEVEETLSQLREGNLKVLYVSPERFFSPDFLSMLEDIPPISLMVVDEAHCLSEWSHNFRPAYLRIRASVLRSKLQVQCILAMTATATTRALSDIMCALHIDPVNLIKTCQIRDNLQLSVTWSNNRLKDLLVLLRSTPLDKVGSIIVYCKFQAETETVCKYLQDNSISSKSYHGGIPPSERRRIQEQFCRNKFRVIVATVAFGMGFDKGDVGAVIHYSMPGSLEEYVQETGRAGRDGRLSYCHLLLDGFSYYRPRSLLYSDATDEYMINKLLFEVFGSDKSSPKKICYLVKEPSSRKFDMKEEVILTILTHLELGKVQYIALLPQLNVTCTLHFHKMCPALLANKDALVASIMQTSENKNGSYVFDIPAVANSLQIEASDVLGQLQSLKEMGEITYVVTDASFCYRILKEPDDILCLATDIGKWLSDVQCCKVSKLDAMFSAADYAARECKGANGCSGSLHTACMQKNIVDYFAAENSYSHYDLSSRMKKSSPFLRADIKVFLQNNASFKFTPRAVARIMYGIPSPAFPSASWSTCHFWGRYSDVDFPDVMEAATLELRNFVGKGGL